MKLLLENWHKYLTEDCWDGYERVEGSVEGAPGSSRKKGSVNEEETTDAEEENQEVDEGKICDAGISYVLRTDAGNRGKDIHRGSDGKLKNWSARAAQIASKRQLFRS